MEWETAQHCGLGWDQRGHTHYTLFSFPTKQVSKTSRVGPYSINIQQMRFEFEELLSSNKEKKCMAKKWQEWAHEVQINPTFFHHIHPFQAQEKFSICAILTKCHYSRSPEHTWRLSSSVNSSAAARPPRLPSRPRQRLTDFTLSFPITPAPSPSIKLQTNFTF